MMKFLKYFLGIIAVLVLLFLAKGLLTPSIDYTSEITVNKSAKEAWAVMQDESKTSQWLKGITNTEHISGEKGTVGAVTKYTFTEGDNEQIVMETIKAIRPYEYMEMDFEMPGAMDMDYSISFSEKDGKTHIQSATSNKGQGIFMRSILSFMEGTMQTQEDENLNNLKQVIETNTTDYFPAPVVEQVAEQSE